MPKSGPLTPVKSVKHTMREALVKAGQCFDGLELDASSADCVCLAARFAQWWDEVAAPALCDAGYEVHLSEGQQMKSIDIFAGLHDPNTCGCRTCQLIRSN